jgi:hypothetical protein
MSQPEPCPHCGIMSVSSGRAGGGANGAIEAAIERGAQVMARMDPERTPEQHRYYVRAVVMGIREHLIQRHLYDTIFRQYNRERPDA